MASPSFALRESRYLFYVTRFFKRIIPLIVHTRQEWRDDVLA